VPSAEGEEEEIITPICSDANARIESSYPSKLYDQDGHMGISTNTNV
jgi:hypothetical protein